MQIALPIFSHSSWIYIMIMEWSTQRFSELDLLASSVTVAGYCLIPLRNYLTLLSFKGHWEFICFFWSQIELCWLLKCNHFGIDRLEKNDHIWLWMMNQNYTKISTPTFIPFNFIFPGVGGNEWGLKTWRGGSTLIGTLHSYIGVTSILVLSYDWKNSCLWSPSLYLHFPFSSIKCQ